MGYFDTMDWKAIRKDIQKGWKESVAVVKEGAVVARKKAGKLTDEGKRRYKVYELKTRVYKKIYDLGERVHGLLSGRRKAANPALDATVRNIMTDIGKMEAQIAKLAGKKAPARTAAKIRTSATRMSPRRRKA